MQRSLPRFTKIVLPLVLGALIIWILWGQWDILAAMMLMVGSHNIEKH